MGEARAQRIAATARRARAGDARALEQLLQDLRPRVVRTTRMIVGADTAAAEDAAQDALVDVMRGIGRIRDVEAVEAWALRIAVRRALRVARYRRLLQLFAPIPVDAVGVDASPHPDDVDVVRRAFYTLPPKMRALAVLRLHVGLSEAETADVLGVQVGTVKSQLNAARARLSRELDRDGVKPRTARPSPACVSED